MYAGTVFIEQATKIDTYAAIAIIVTVAALFTVTGNYTGVR